jgi:hypothetical protein
MKDLRYDLRAAGLEVDWCWHVEPNPAGTGHHVHGWQRGDFLPQGILSEMADGCGMGRVCDVRKWRPKGGPAVSYGLKLAGIGYGLKMAEGERQLEEYLRVNGGRMVHSSRGFWVDVEGKRCSLRDARQSWSQLSGDDVGPWYVRREEVSKSEENKERQGSGG